MKRPILVAMIGYLIGIIVGLYLNFSIVFLYLPIIAMLIIYKSITKEKSKPKKIKLLSPKRYIRYLKLYLNNSILIMIIVVSIISNFYIRYKNDFYEDMYYKLSQVNNLDLVGIVISNKNEGEYYNKYIIKCKYENKNIKLYMQVKKSSKVELEYGDKIKIKGKYIEPLRQRNYGGFDYSLYLKQHGVCGNVKCEKINVVSKEQGNILLYKINKISLKIKERIYKIMPEKHASILIGLTLGEKTNIDEDMQESFRNANMSHILAISGMHITYLILGVNIILKKRLGKRLTNVISIFILIFYMFIANFTPSITRAVIMGVILIGSKLLYRKNDIWTSISVSLLMILIYNPFLILDLGLQLSYSGTIGIIVFSKYFERVFKSIKIKNKKWRYFIESKITRQIQNILDKIVNITSVSLSVQISIISVILFKLNTFYLYFLISNLLLSIIIGPIIILAFLFIIILLIDIKTANAITSILIFLINILIYISKLGELPYSKIYVATPKKSFIIIYLFSILIIKILYQVYTTKKPNQTQMRIKNLIALIKFKYNIYKLKFIKIFIFILIIILLIHFIPKKLNINFIDVEQGDSCFIVTPKSKTILIDGGGSEISNFDVR